MHMRPKPWARPELAACPFFIAKDDNPIGQWHERFQKQQPIWLELGMGKGLCLTEQAYAHPERNFIGIDMISDVLGVARRNIVLRYGDRPVDNILLMAQDVERILWSFNEADTVERIYIQFPNPWYKDRHHKKRLTHTRYLERYKTFLPPGGEIHFKTDDRTLYEASREYFSEAGYEMLLQTTDLHGDEAAAILRTPMSEHEQRYVSEGLPIYGIRAVRV